MSRAWNEGISVSTQLVTAATDEPLTVEFVRDEHLRVANGSLEDTKIGRMIKSAREHAEYVTQRALMPQTWKMLLSGFPCGPIVFPYPPFGEVTSLTYIDANGDEQELATSPAEFISIAPSGPRARRGYIVPNYGEVWPTARIQPNAVSVTFTCGYDVVGGVPSVPSEITDGMLLMIGELYKLRSESVQQIHNNPAVLRAEQLWQPYKVF